MAKHPKVCGSCKHLCFDSGFDGVEVSRRQEFYYCGKGRFMPFKKESCSLYVARIGVIPSEGNLTQRAADLACPHRDVRAVGDTLECKDCGNWL